jgi:hypothetical protein
MLTIDTRDPRADGAIVRQFAGRAADGGPIDEGLSQRWLSLRPTLDQPDVAEFIAQLPEPVVFEDPANQVGDQYRDLVIESGTESAVMMPILWQGQLEGVFYFASYRKDAFGPQEVALMKTIAAQIAPSIQVATLHVELEHSYAELKSAHRDAILRLAYAAEARDPYTGRHLQRIGALSEEIARRMGFDDEQVEAVGYAAIVHDLGKLRIPDAILIKPGELTPEDWTVMKRHPEWGADLLGAGLFFDMAREVALHHHERWDGSGYPFGLEGEAIPRAARIVMVADIYDALISARPYKAAWPAPRALAELRAMRGSKLCPETVDVFLSMWEDGTVAHIEADTADATFEGTFRERWAA